MNKILIVLRFSDFPSIMKQLKHKVRFFFCFLKLLKINSLLNLCVRKEQQSMSTELSRVHL